MRRPSRPGLPRGRPQASAHPRTLPDRSRHRGVREARLALPQAAGDRPSSRAPLMGPGAPRRAVTSALLRIAALVAIGFPGSAWNGAQARRWPQALPTTRSRRAVGGRPGRRARPSFGSWFGLSLVELRGLEPLAFWMQTIFIAYFYVARRRLT